MLDENFDSPLTASELNKLPNWRFEAHRAHLEPATGDRVVANFCAGRRWALVTVDDMRYDEDTKIALYRGDVHVFKLVTQQITHRLILQSSLMLARDEMIALDRHEKLAFVAHIHRGGSVKIVTTFDEYRHHARLTDSQRRTLLSYPHATFDNEKHLKAVPVKAAKKNK